MEKQKSYGIIEWVMKMKSFNYEEMFAQSIGLQEPWRVERVEYDEEEERIWRHGDVCFFHVMFTAGDQGSNAEHSEWFKDWMKCIGAIIQAKLKRYLIV